MLSLAFLLAVRLAPGAPEMAFKQPQLAVGNGAVAAVFGAGDDLYVATSRDGAKSFDSPVRIPSGGKLYLGRRRGPRIAIAGNQIVISAIAGRQGRGKDGDLLSWRSADGGKTWSGPVSVSDQAGAAREGLHGMAAGRDGSLFAAWLDLREGAMALYGARSADGGASWSKNFRIYQSPDGHICECCHPSVAIGPDGATHVMWRNWLGGSRDMFLATAAAGEATFKTAKLGEGNWPLNACPMDGGGVAVDGKGNVVTAWRRESTVFLSKPGSKEIELGAGKDPSIVLGPDGTYIAWSGQDGLKLLRPGANAPVPLAGKGGAVNLASGKAGVFAAWESDGSIYVEALNGATSARR